MHKLVLKFFEFLENCIHFLKIFSIFLIMMLLLDWIQSLTNSFWEWTSFIKPLLNSILIVATEIGDKISFKYEYFISLFLLLIFYFLGDLFVLIVKFLRELYIDGRDFLRRKEEENFNKSLDEQNFNEQKKIKKYQIYIEAFVKSKYSAREFNINLEEQNKIMNKFLIEKTSSTPIKYGEGFLYSFENFANIDNILDIFDKLPKSKAPLDYLICVQINDGMDNKRQLESLINLKVLNKITALSDTVYRYSFNAKQTYETSQLGIFQCEDGTIEAHYFIKKDSV